MSFVICKVGRLVGFTITYYISSFDWKWFHTIPIGYFDSLSTFILNRKKVSSKKKKKKKKKVSNQTTTTLILILDK